MPDFYLNANNVTSGLDAGFDQEFAEANRARYERKAELLKQHEHFAALARAREATLVSRVEAEMTNDETPNNVTPMPTANDPERPPVRRKSA